MTDLDWVNLVLGIFVAAHFMGVYKTGLELEGLRAPLLITVLMLLVNYPFMTQHWIYPDKTALAIYLLFGQALIALGVFPLLHLVSGTGVHLRSLGWMIPSALIYWGFFFVSVLLMRVAIFLFILWMAGLFFGGRGFGKYHYVRRGWF